MTIKEIKIEELHEYENNPRHNENAVDAVAASIKNFGFKVPIVIDKDNVIIAGHTRLKAARKLGMNTVPCIVADDLTPDQVKAFRLADNKVGELAEWDENLLNEELKQLQGVIEMDSFGFDDLEEISKELDNENPYSNGVKIPQYEPTGEAVDLAELYDDSKAKALLEEIEASEVPEKIKQFLRFAAYRHIVFNFKKIAEYYANTDAETQKLFEQSALVIVDINDALANGWVKLSKTIEEMIEYEE